MFLLTPLFVAAVHFFRFELVHHFVHFNMAKFNNERDDAIFPYLMNDEYEVWAMKMEHWIMKNDMNIWKVIQNGNSLKRHRRDQDGNVIILPPTTADEHIAVQRESKARTTLLKSIPADHVADFHYIDEASDIWNAIKARYGGKAESKKMRKEACTISKTEEFALMGLPSQVHNCFFGCSERYNELKEAYDELKPKYNECYVEVEAYKQALKTLERQKIWFQKNQPAYDEKIRVLESDLECTRIDLKRTEKEKANIVSENQVLKEKLDEEVARHKTWLMSGDNLASLLYGSQSVNSGIGLGFKKYVGLKARNDLGKSTPAGLANYVKERELHAVPGPIRGEHMPTDLSITIDFDGSHHLYGKKSSDLPDPDSKSTDLVSCSDSDKSSDQGSTTYISCDSSEKSDSPRQSLKITPKSKVADNEPKTKTVTYSVKHNFLSSFVSDKFVCNKQSCVKDKSFKKKYCFVCGSKSHLIKDCDFHEKRMGVCADQKRPRSMWTNVNDIPPYVPQATHKTSRPKPADKPVSADRSFLAHWKRHVARPFYIPTSTYFQNGFWPGYYNPRYMGGGGQDGILVLSPQQVVLGQIKEKVHSGYPRTIVFVRCTD